MQVHVRIETAAVEERNWGLTTFGWTGFGCETCFGLSTILKANLHGEGDSFLVSQTACKPCMMPLSLKSMLVSGPRLPSCKEFGIKP